MTHVMMCNGKVFDFTKTTMPHVTPEVIAHSLAHQCRFGGHTPQFYSVAEHSVHVMHLVERPDAYAALMHDAHKAVMLDIIKPLKTDYHRDFEAMVIGLFEDHYGYVLHQGINAADDAMLAAEYRQFFGHDLPDRDLAARGLEVLRGKAKLSGCMSPVTAKAVWLNAFESTAPVRMR